MDEILSALSTLPLSSESSPYILNILAHFYERYCDLKDFFPSLVKSCVHQDSSKGLDLMRFSAVLNLVGGCVELAICPVDTVINMLKGMIAKTQDKKPKACVSVILNFLEQFGDVFLEIPVDKMKEILRMAAKEAGTELSEEALLECEYKAFVRPDERIVTPSEVQQFNNILVPFFELLCSKLASEHEALSQMEKEKHDKLSGIRASEQSSTATTTSYDTYSAKVKKWDKTLKAAKLLGMYLSLDIPQKVLEGTFRIKAMEVEQQKEKGYFNIVVSAFDDDELAFYTVIPKIEFNDQGESLINEQEDNESIFQQLPNLTQSQVEQFCRKYYAKFGNSKSGKRKLVKYLFGVKRTSLELLPLYAKVVKTIEPEGGELSDQLISSLRTEFEKLFAERDQIKIESKVKNIRFMCELVKFKIMDPHIILSFLKQCLNEFRHHNIDVACACIENCGRFLMASEDESVGVVVKQLVDKMWRLKCVKSLEERYENMVENAYFSLFASNDNQTMGSDSDFVGKITNPLLLYIRHLLLNIDVNPGEKSANKCMDIVKQLRKLPYNSQPDLPEKIANIVMILDSKYENLPSLASIISALGRYRQRVLILVIDALLERIRWNLAYGDQFFRQQGIKDMKFLGELYNYQAVDLNVIEDVWFMCISYARWNNDSPYECYRIQLICESLMTVSRCITEATDKKRLDRFLLYFQRYVLGKGVRLPVHVEFLLADTLDVVKPNLLWPKSFTEACERVRVIEHRRKIQWPGEFMANFTTDVSQLDAFDNTGRWVLKDQNEKLWPVEPDKFRNYTLESNPEDRDDSDSEDESSNENSEAIKQMHQQTLQVEEAARKRKQRIEEMEFDKEYQQMLSESVNERRKERPMAGQKLLRVEELLKNFQQQQQQPTSEELVEESKPMNIEEREGKEKEPVHRQPLSNGIKMLVLMRRGKQKVREMDVPIDSSLAHKTVDARQQAIEQEEMQNEHDAKRVILMNMKNRRDT